MFRIRLIHDDVLEADRVALTQVQSMLRAQFPGLRHETVDELPTLLRDPLAHRIRTFVFVAERQRQNDVRGFAILAHAPDLEFCYLDFISAAPKETGRGVGGALYERVREECRALGAKGLLFECLPDDPDDVSDPATLEQNRARLRFYERWGARPVIHTAYRTAIEPGGSTKDLPYLVFDDLGSGRPLGRDEAREIVRAILERKYAWLVTSEYVGRVVESIVDDPIELRPSRYRRKKVNAPSTPLPIDVPAHLRIPLLVAERHDVHHVRERGYVEAPVRIPVIKRELDRLPIFEPTQMRRFGREPIVAVHDDEFVDYLERVCAALPPKRSAYPYVFPVRNAGRMPDDLETRAGWYCIDTFTPLHKNVWLAATDAVDCALTGAAMILEGKARLAYALVRPPGHHAEHKSFGGFCYLNSAAIAAHHLGACAGGAKVAILDVDYHHGNGQQEIFWERGDVLTVSIHGHPRFAYPYFTGFEDEIGWGDGEGANLNLPLPEQVDGAAYDLALARALDAVRAFEPSFLVVCLGLDPGRGDPTGTWSLGASDFERNGRRIGALGVPTLVVQEGGYHTRNLGVHARHFFRGLWESATGRSLARADT
ncbi:GNAT family N-acetyltransferase [Sandaracinus amylolyticus]|uniref:Deacetylase n=1 Tax=Sandaracinus amylolyticus TaxID=927083 RepID=A0A0F6W1L0_9BACT|nr:GNAT family N-acetyltransferase [Sandaracinus amylolyticus]AKF05175.1 Deacetylase [Sandaracinus amylolyticus]